DTSRARVRSSSMISSRFRFTAVLITTLLVIFAPFSRPIAHAANPSLVIDIGYETATLDPQINYDTAAAIELGNVYDGLVRAVGAKGAKIVPDLATSWSSSADGKTWTFHLRSGVKFHDGNSVDAAAVKFSFDRLLKLNLGAVGDFLEVSSVTASNPSTVVFHLSHAFSGFLNSLTTLWGPDFVSPKTLLAHQLKGAPGTTWLNDPDAGSGPWMVGQWVH